MAKETKISYDSFPVGLTGDFANDKSRYDNGFYRCAGRWGQVSNFLEDLMAIVKFVGSQEFNS